MNKSFISNFLSVGNKQQQPSPLPGTQGPPQMHTAVRRESKALTTGSIVQHLPPLDEPLKDYTLYLQLPPNHHKYLVEVDKSMQISGEMIYSNMDKLDQQLQNVLSVSHLLAIRQTFQYLQELIRKLNERDLEVQQLKANNEELIQTILSKEKVLQNIEQTYTEQMHLITMRAHEQTQGCENQYEAFKNLIDQLQQQLNEKKTIETNLLLRMKSLEDEKNELLQQKINIQLENTNLRDELDVFRDIRTGSLIINKIYQKAIQEQPKGKEFPLYNLFLGKFRNQMVKYFEPKDLLNLLLFSRKISLVQHIVQCKTQSLILKLQDARLEANYFYELADRIPEEILQQGIAKFLAFRFQAGSYCNDLFKDIYDFIEGKFEQSLNQQSNNSVSQLAELFNLNNEVETTDLIGLDDHTPHNNPPQQKNQQQPKQNSQNGLFSKLKNLAVGTNTPNKQNPPQQSNHHQDSGVSLGQLSQQLQQELSSLGEICTKALSIPYLRNQLQQTRQDMVELNQRSVQINQQLFSLGQKCVQPDSKLSIQDFLKKLQYNFSRLLANSHYLRLECSQIQHTTNYLAQLILRQNRQTNQQQTKFDDLLEETKTLRQMNSFHKTRMRALEERVHKGEEDVLQFSNKNTQLTTNNKQLSQELEETIAKCKEKESILKLLAITVKNQNQEKLQLQRTLSNIHQNFSQIKYIIPHILEQPTFQPEHQENQTQQQLKH